MRLDCQFLPKEEVGDVPVLKKRRVGSRSNIEDDTSPVSHSNSLGLVLPVLATPTYSWAGYNDTTIPTASMTSSLSSTSYQESPQSSACPYIPNSLLLH
jgi:hypothetical protein